MNEVFNERLRIKMLLYIDVTLFLCNNRERNPGFFVMNTVSRCVKRLHLDLNKFIC